MSNKVCSSAPRPTAKPFTSLTQFLRWLRYIGSMRRVPIFIVHVFEVRPEIERFG